MAKISLAILVLYFGAALALSDAQGTTSNKQQGYLPPKNTVESVRIVDTNRKEKASTTSSFRRVVGTEGADTLESKNKRKLKKVKIK